MREKKSNKRAPLFSVTHLGLILLCLVLITGHITGDIYAKYATEEGGDDGGRVIYFGDLTVTEKNDLHIAPGATLQRQSFVSFGGSEAATILFVKISAPGWAWNEDTLTYSNLATLKVADGWEKLEDGIYYRQLSPNEKFENVEVFADDGKFTLPQKGISELEAMKNTTVTVEAIVVQKGVGSVEETWQKVGSTT